MAYLKPQTPLKDLNSGDYFYPLTTSDQIFLSDTTTRLSSLIDHTNFTASRAIYYDGTKLLSSENIFLNDNSIAINQTSITSGINFEVNGQSNFKDLITGTRLILTTTTDATAASANAVALIIGSQTGQHLEFDGNEIMSKSDGTTAATLNFQVDGGYTYFGAGGVGINGINTDYNFYVKGTSYFEGNTTHNGVVYFANGTTYSISNSGSAVLNAITAYSSYTLNTSSTVDSTVMNVSTREGTTAIGTKTYTNTTITQNSWGQIYYRTPALHKVYNTAGDTSSGVASSSYYQPYWWFNQYSLNTSTGARTSYYEIYKLPETNNNRTSNATYNILTTKNLSDADSRFVTLSTEQTITGNKTFNAILYFANGTTYYINKSGTALLNSIIAYGAFGVSRVSVSAATLLNISTRAGTSSIGTGTTTYQTRDQSSWAQIDYILPSYYRTYNTAGDTSSGIASRGYQQPYFRFVQYSLDTSNGLRTSYREYYRLPLTDNNKTGNSTYYILTTKEYSTPAKGTATRMAYYSSASNIASGSITSDGGYLGAVTYLDINHAHSTSYRLYVNGTSYFNGNATATKLYGAVWNDYAEFRKSDINEPGYVIAPSEDDIAHKTSYRMQPGARIVSDTFGFAVGKCDDAKTPVGLAGRVLAYTYQKRSNYKIGDVVCAAPNGTVDIMTREEIQKYPDRIIGIVNEIPDYKIWKSILTHSDGEQTIKEIEVKDRIWIDIK